MEVKVYRVYKDETLVFRGSVGDIALKLQYSWPWLQKFRTLNEMVAALDRCQAYSAVISDQQLLKHDSHVSSQVIDDLHGFVPENEPAFKAAQFLSGLPPISRDAARIALYQEEDPKKAALMAYGLEPTPDNLRALQAILDISKISKAEHGELNFNKTPDVKPVTQDGREVADQLIKAYQAGLVLPVQLAGKHSVGSFIARDEQDGKSYLLKPDSGGSSPAAGIAHTAGTQPAREACFYHVAKLWGLDHWMPQAELISIDGKQYSVQTLIPFNYTTLERRRKADPNLAQRLFRIPLTSGDLHKWAVLDGVLGNVDRHFNNVMVNDDGDIKLIDHGSAFAGSGFDPAHDQNTFVPAYLRAWSPANFNQLRPEEKLRTMPKASKPIDKLLQEWISSIDPDQLAATLTRYGIDPGATLERLERFKDLMELGPASEAIDKFWVT